MATVAPVQHEATPFILEACRQSRPVSLAIPIGKEWGMCRSRLLSFDSDTSRVRITQPSRPCGKDPVPMVQGSELGVRFIAQDRRIMFMANVYGFCCYYEDSERLEGVELAVASNIICANQRQHYRASVPEEYSLEMVLRDASITQRLGDSEEPPPTYHGTIRDLSIGGAFVGGLNADPQWKLEDHLGIELRIPGEDPVLLIAEIRRVAQEDDGMPGYGLAFIGAETIRKTFDAQEVLSRVVTDLQRMHLQHRIESTSSHS